MCASEVLEGLSMCAAAHGVQFCHHDYMGEQAEEAGAAYGATRGNRAACKDACQQGAKGCPSEDEGQPGKVGGICAIAASVILGTRKTVGQPTHGLQV